MSTSAGDGAPVPVPIPPVPLGVEIPPEPPEIAARGLYLAARLMAGATTFFFLAFVFAYFYLRSLNQSNMWHPAHVHPIQGLGAAIVACVVVSAGLTLLAERQMRHDSTRWLTSAGGALLLGVLALGLQALEYTQQGFGPTNGAYASVFVAWTGFYAVAVLGAMYWLEVQVATEARARRSPARRDGDIHNPDRLIEPALTAAAFFWTYLAGIGVVTYVVLYLL